MRVTRKGRPPRGERTRQSKRGRAVVCFVLALLLLAPAPVLASPDTLRRSFSNMLMGPFDMILSPIVGGLTLARNLQDIDDSPGVRVVYALPGWVWLTGLNFGAGGIRTFTGVLEVIPGVLLFPFADTDVDPLFDPVVDAGALIEIENPIIDYESPWIYYNPLVVPFAITLKTGINYTTAEN